VETITKEELSKALGNDRPVLIDLRLNWAAGSLKIKTAVHEEAEDVDNWASRYDSDQMIVLYCSTPAEKTSRATAQKLLQKGFSRVKVLRGGWVMWQTSDLPVQRKDKAPTPKGIIREVLSD
jgi:rhodanese-related sulfurtransferase